MVGKDAEQTASFRVFAGQLEDQIINRIAPTIALLLVVVTASPLTAEERSIEEWIQMLTEDQPPRANAAPPIGPPATAKMRASSQVAENAVVDFDVEAMNAAGYSADGPSQSGANALILKAQVLLDRAGASPGVIDSYDGENVSKAIATVETVLGLPVDGRLDPQVWAALGGDDAPAVLVEYTITEEDTAGPFLREIPEDYSEQAPLKSLAYTGPAEMLAERFHMDLDLLTALNPDVDFAQPGSSIFVVAVQGEPIVGEVARIDVDKKLKQLRAYDTDDRLVVAYPATIGSGDNPSPIGTHKVDSVTKEPFYNYDPENFVQGDNHEKLTLPPGPNNPVGTIWIGLTEKGYGIHGTPDPSKIDKTGSHGCVRLTNWDAEELARLVEPGVTVSFLE